MEMQAGAVVMPEKIPVQWYNFNHHQQPPHHQMDEREGFLMWLRSEFAASNAIIDALCHHFRALGAPGEYDGVIGSIQQRRCNWIPILHMQQYFSVADIVYALQQVSWKRQHRSVGHEGNPRTEGGAKEFSRGGNRGHRGIGQVQNLDGEVYGKDPINGRTKASLNANVKLDGEKDRVEEKETELSKKSEVNLVTSEESTDGAISQAEAAGSCSVDGSALVLEMKPNLEVSPKTFVAAEMCDGKSVNIAEGMKLYKDLFNDSMISKIITSLNDLRAAGRRGQLQGQTFVISKRPMKGHGREMIQCGVPVVDAPPEDGPGSVTSKDMETEPIPEIMQNVIEWLLTERVLNFKPDSCIIDFFNEGDHSQPHIWPQWFRRPVCVLFLTECEMSFGRVITVEHPGYYQGILNLSLSSGSILTMQGKSADFARHAIPSIRKQRILVTLVKAQPRKTIVSDAHRFPPVAAPPSRSPSHIHPVAAKHFSPIPPPTGALPAQTASPQLTAPNVIQPIFVPPTVAPIAPAPAPAPAPAGWPAATARYPPPRLPLPGTGVFLPSKSCSNSSNQSAAIVAPKAVASDESEDHHALVEAEQECNGRVGTEEGTVIIKDEERVNDDSAKSARAA